MKAIIPLAAVLAAALAAGSGFSQTASTNAPVVTHKLSADQIARFVALARRQLETEAQSRLLKAMAQEHTRRGEEATRERLLEKARWENDLALELDKKADDLLKQSNAVAQERIAFEEQNRVLDATLPGGLTPDENAYLARVDEHLAEIQRELADLATEVIGYNAALQTNTSPDDIGHISDLIQVNNLKVRQLQRSQTDMELKKLEFRALRR